MAKGTTMYPITFRKDRAAYLLDRLLHGQPIEPDQSGWTVDDMMQLAGACFFAVAAQGPAADVQQVHPEYQEAEFETMMNDLHAVLEFVAQRTQMVYDGDYDEAHEPVVRCGIRAVNTYVEASVARVEGFKHGEGRGPD